MHQDADMAVNAHCCPSEACNIITNIYIPCYITVLQGADLQC